MRPSTHFREHCRQIFDYLAHTDNEDDVAANPKLTESEKKDILQRALLTAASNGEIDRIQRILGGKARAFVNLDAPDEEGTSPIIYASCFVRVTFCLALHLC